MSCAAVFPPSNSLFLSPKPCGSTEGAFPGKEIPEGGRLRVHQGSGPLPKLSADGNFESLWTAGRNFFSISRFFGDSSFVRQQHPLWSESSISSRTFPGVSEHLHAKRKRVCGEGGQGQGSPRASAGPSYVCQHDPFQLWYPAVVPSERGCWGRGG